MNVMNETLNVIDKDSFHRLTNSRNPKKNSELDRSTTFLKAAFKSDCMQVNRISNAL